METNFEVVYHRGAGFTKQALPAAPSLAADQARIRPLQVGICGSDLFLLEGSAPTLRLGHEWVGKVEAVGADVTDVQVGNLVTGTGHFSCGHCAECLQGDSNLCADSVHFSSDQIGALRSGFEAPAQQLVILPNAFHRGQVLHEILAVGEQAVALLADLSLAKTQAQVLIFGAGPIGISIALALQSEGASTLLVEKYAERVMMARKLGLNAMTLAEALLRTEMQNRSAVLVDASNDYSGDAGGFRLLTHFAGRKFVALIVGKYKGAQTLTSEYNRRAGQLRWMRGVSLSVLQKSVSKWDAKLEGLAEHLISHVYDLESTNQAFAMARDKRQSLKVVLSCS